MERSLLSYAVIGAVLSGGFGAAAGAGLRIDPPERPGPATAATPFMPVSFEAAPPYPAWAPPPLYGRDTDEDLMTAWLPGLENEPLPDVVPTPVRFEAPADLPPPYEVRSVAYDRGPPPEFRPQRERRDIRRGGDPRFAPEPRYAPEPRRYARAPEPRHHRPPPPRYDPPPPAPRAWVDRDGYLYVEAPPPPPPMPVRDPRYGPPPPPPLQPGPPLDRAGLFF